MSQKNVRWIGLAVAILFVLFLFPLCPMIRTAREMHQAGVFLQSRPSAGDLQARYRKTANVYPDYESLPEYYRPGFGAFTNCEFHVYQREGLPYWFFVAAVDRHSRIVEQGVVRKLGK